MTVNSWVGGAINGTPGNVTRYLGLANFSDQTNGLASAEVQAKLPSAAGTYSKMSIFVSANAAATATLTFRKNAAAGNQTVNIGSSATGWFQDTTNSDTVADGDLVNLRLVTGAGITYKGAYSCAFNTATFATNYMGQGGEVMSTDFVGTNQDYFWGGYAGKVATTELATKLTIRAAGAFTKLSILGNTAAQVPFIRSRLNGADGALTLAQGAGTDGVLQTDSTHTDTVASGDTWGFRTSTSGTRRWAHVSVRFVSGNTKFDLVSGPGSGTLGSGTHYLPIIGEQPGTQETTEANANTKAPAQFSLTKLRVTVGTNALVGGSLVYTLRINGADGSNTITVPIVTTGLFEDTTHTDGIAAGDLVCVKAVGSNSSGSVQAIMGILADGATSSTETGDGDMEFSGLSMEGGGANRHTGTAAMEFGLFEIVAAAEFEEHGTATMEFSGLALAGVGSVIHIQGTADMEFGLFSIAAVGGHGPSGAGAMLFGVIEFAAAGGSVVPAGDGVRQFWTFGS